MERLVRAQEQERSRVAADLHDDTIQVMSACVISLDSVRLAVQNGNARAGGARPRAAVRADLGAPSSAPAG